MKGIFGSIAPGLLAIIIDNLGFGLVYPVFAAYFTSNVPLIQGMSVHMRDFTLGLSYLLYPLCMFFGASILGDVSDIYGRKKVILLCMIGITLSFLLMGLGMTFSSLFLLFLGRALSGLFAGSQPIVQAAIIDMSTKENKTFNMSLIGLTLSIGLVLGPLLGGIFSDKSLGSFFRFSTPFYISTALAFCSVLWIFFRFQETFQKNTKKQLDIFRPIKIFYDVFRNGRLTFLSLIFFIMQIGFSLFFTLVLIYLRKAFSYPNWEMGVYNAWIGISFIFGMFVIARFVTKKFRAESIAAVSMMVTALGQLFFFLPLTDLWVWILTLPIAASDMLAYTTVLTSFSNTADKDSQGWVMGVAISVMAIAWVFSGFGTNLLDILSPNHIIGIGGLLLIVSSSCMFIYSTKKI